MLAAALTLAMLALVSVAIARIVLDDARKIGAALQGRSWASEPPSPIRPVTVRYSPRYPVSRVMRVLPELRAAA